jgi:hypothetical protein
MITPRQECISAYVGHFGLKMPTAHKSLSALQSKGYLYFGRDSKSGFLAHLIERAGSAEIVMELPAAGKIGAFAEPIDFPSEIGHFTSIFVGGFPDPIFALAVSEDIPRPVYWRTTSSSSSRSIDRHTC